MKNIKTIRHSLKNDRGRFARYAILLGAKYISPLLIMLLFQTVGIAQQSVVVDVSPRQLTTDGVLTVVVTVRGQTVPMPPFPTSDQFKLIRSEIIDATQPVDGIEVKATQFVYVLQPTKAGELTVGTFVVEVNGVRIETEPQKVEVEDCQLLSSIDGMIPDAANINSEEYLFFVTSVDNNRPWLGEQVVYTFWLFMAEDTPGIVESVLTPPQFERFWNSNLNEKSCYWVTLGNRLHRIIEYSSRVYPAEAGNQIIGSPTLDVTWEQSGSSFLFAFGEMSTIFGEDIAVDVRPLPENAPADFTGAVGDFTIERDVDGSAVDMSDDVTMNVTVSGSGNFGALPEPMWPDLDGWRVIDQETNTVTELTDAGVGGERTWTQVLIPTEPGEREIPTLTYSFFNPETARYETAQAESFAVDVTGDAVRSEVAAVADETRPEIRSNRGVPDQLSEPEPLLQEQRSYWAWWLVPLAIVLGAEAIVGARKRPKRPRKLKLFTSQAERLDAVLSERFGVQFGGVTHARRRELLDQFGVDDGLIGQIDAFYREDEMKQFMGDHADEVDAGVLIDAIMGGR